MIVIGSFDSEWRVYNNIGDKLNVRHLHNSRQTPLSHTQTLPGEENKLEG
jgi:hypothetical protein